MLPDPPRDPPHNPPRTVIVTGGSRGLGLAMADHLAHAGYRVIAIARQEGEPLALARRMHGDRLQFQAADLMALESLPALVRGLRTQHGPIYGLVNNAGIGTGGLLANMHDTAIAQLIQLNVVSPITLTKYVVRSMMSAGTGRIVMISSIVGATGYRGLSVYSATKASLEGFTRSLAREVGALDITVNAVAPGFVATDMTGELDDAHRARIARRSALKRMPEACDVAHAVGYLLSPGARNVTGTVLTVDAGNTA